MADVARRLREGASVTDSNAASVRMPRRHDNTASTRPSMMRSGESTALAKVSGASLPRPGRSRLQSSPVGNSKGVEHGQPACLGVQVHFALAKQQLKSIDAHLRKKPPDQAADVAVLGSALQEMCTGLRELTEFIDRPD
jgi:hypothetical protein